MVGTKKVPNSLQVSLVSPQTPEQVSLRCYIDLKGKRKAWTETRIRQSIEHRLPWRSSRRSPDIPDLVKHCVRSHTEYTRQHQSTDVKVWDNSTTRTLRFGKETADQAIQRGNARVYNTKANSTSPSTIAGDQPSLPRGYNEREPKEDTNCRNQQTDPGRLATVTGNPSTDSVEKGPKFMGIHCKAVKKPSQTAGIHCKVGKTRLKLPESTAKLTSALSNWWNPLQSCDQAPSYDNGELGP
ncbi:hypothetical protein R3P38DRAFT_2770883 [Favolaschia claudopus]|uniref:Uncharacterized protein n=1 Tax=Favolaschia claudopus TaxID=2862362 RepID=A0AAW0CJ33_9AGAR